MSEAPVSSSDTRDWENEGGSLSPASDLAALGITRLIVEKYLVGGYAYTKLSDAIAQSRRMNARPEVHSLGTAAG